MKRWSAPFLRSKYGQVRRTYATASRIGLAATAIGPRGVQLTVGGAEQLLMKEDIGAVPVVAGPVPPPVCGQPRGVPWGEVVHVDARPRRRCGRGGHACRGGVQRAVDAPVPRRALAPVVHARAAARAVVEALVQLGGPVHTHLATAAGEAGETAAQRCPLAGALVQCVPAGGTGAQPG
eukprot:scaffold1669_cov108-Isochrysis_galbana.AAC.9